LLRTASSSWNFEFHKRHLLVIAVLVIAFTTAFIMRSYPAKYGFYLNEFDPYFNYRATKYILDNGLDAYWKWNDKMSWYHITPDGEVSGRWIIKSEQSGLFIFSASVYKILDRVAGISLLDFTIILPVILGSLTTIVVFALVRTISGGATAAGMFAALLFAFSPIIIQRGNLGWFKSEPFGLFFGLLAIYLLLSGLRHKKEELTKYAIPKSIAAGVIFGFANASWGGAQYFSIPISLFFIILPFIKKEGTDNKSSLYYATVITAIAFTLSTIISTVAFPDKGISFIFTLPSIALIGGTLFLIFAYYLKKLSAPRRELRNTLILLICFFSIAGGIIVSGMYSSSTPRYFDAVNPFYSYPNPVYESVAEHSSPTLLDYLTNYSILLIYVGIGIWWIISSRHNNKKGSNEMLIFALIIALTGIYVSTAFVRLLVFSSIGIIILAAIGLYSLTQTFMDSGKPSSATVNEILSQKTTSKKAAETKTSTTETTKTIHKKRKSYLVYNRSYTADNRLIKIAFTIFTILLLLFPMVYPRDSNWLSLADIPPTILTGGTDSILKNNDWINALHWISNNTPKDSVIAAWWDYGYWITTIGNRATLIDNANINEARVGTIAKMFMEEPEEGVRIAQDLNASYILIFAVAKRVMIVNGIQYYSLGYGGYEDKLYWFLRIGGFDKNLSEYLEADEFTPKPKFWNTTLLAKLIPFTLKGYTLLNDGEISAVNNNTSVFQKYIPDSTALYSKDIKYVEENDTYNIIEKQPLSLVYSSDSFTKSNQDRVSAVLIYKINKSISSK
jgi:dolichyl-diphosphooligosaccharide--protein glycosyltransferase